MVPKLKEIGANVMQFKFDPSRPDLTKLDNLFGLLSTESQDNFEEQVSNMEVEIAAGGVQKVLENMTIDDNDENASKKQKLDNSASDSPCNSTAISAPPADEDTIVTENST